MIETVPELYYEVVSIISTTVMTAATGYCYSYFVRPFVGNRKYIAWVGIAYFAVMMFLRYIPLVLNNTLAYVLGAGAGFLVMWHLDHGNLWQKVFLSVTFFSVRRISMLTSNHIHNIMAQLSYRLPGFYWNFPFQYKIFVVLLVIWDVTGMMLLIFAIRTIQRAYMYKQEPMSKKEMLLLIVPSLSAHVSYRTIDRLDMAYVDVAGWYFQDMDAAFDWQYILFTVVSFASILVTVTIFQDMKNHQREERQSELLARQVADMESHIARVERFYHDMRCLRHDMGNHIMTLEHLCAKNEQAEAERYVTHLKEVFDGELQCDMPIKSGNPVTDVILAEWQEAALEKGVTFDCMFSYPGDVAVNAFDISVILNNAIENAMEGAAGCDEPKIRVTSHRRKNAYLIEIVNNIEGERVLDEESGLPVTTKREGTGHGLGLSNIQSVARKYHGDIEIRQDGAEFALTVLLMLEA